MKKVLLTLAAITVSLLCVAAVVSHDSALYFLLGEDGGEGEGEGEIL